MESSTLARLGLAFNDAADYADDVTVAIVKREIDERRILKRSRRFFTSKSIPSTRSNFLRNGPPMRSYLQNEPTVRHQSAERPQALADVRALGN
jgi:hypothetical protein